MKTPTLALVAVAVVLGLTAPAMAQTELSLTGGLTNANTSASLTGTVLNAPCGVTLDPTNPIVTVIINGITIPAGSITATLSKDKMSVVIQVAANVPAGNIPVDITVMLSNTAKIGRAQMLNFMKVQNGGCSPDGETGPLPTPCSFAERAAPSKTEPDSHEPN